MKYAFIKTQRDDYSLKQLCAVIQVSRSGFYAWHHRKPSHRQQTNEGLIDRIKQIHQRVKETYGSPNKTDDLILAIFENSSHKCDYFIHPHVNHKEFYGYQFYYQ